MHPHPIRDRRARAQQFRWWHECGVRINFKVYSYFSRALAHTFLQCNLESLPSCFTAVRALDAHARHWPKVFTIFRLNCLIILWLRKKLNWKDVMERYLARRWMSAAQLVPFRRRRLWTHDVPTFASCIPPTSSSSLSSSSSSSSSVSNALHKCTFFRTAIRRLSRSAQHSTLRLWQFASIVIRVHGIYTEICIVMKENIVRAIWRSEWVSWWVDERCTLHHSVFVWSADASRSNFQFKMWNIIKSH